MCVQSESKEALSVEDYSRAPGMRENPDVNRATPIGAAGIDVTAAHDEMIQAHASSAPRYGHWAETEGRRSHIGVSRVDGYALVT